MSIHRENLDLIYNHYLVAHHLDDHILHIALHWKILETPEYKNDVFLVERLMKHIGEHTMYIKSMIEL
jgi:hypothetical protein